MADKRKRIICRFILVCICAVIGASLYKNSRYITSENIKDYVLNNTESLNEFAQQLYDNQQESIDIYYKRWDYPTNLVTSKIFNYLYIDRVTIYKGCYDNEDCVVIHLKNKPISSEYYACGIYYSFNDVVLDYTTKAQEGNEYEYDGTPKGVKIKYRSEKICDNWYYFEEDVWN